MSKWKYSYNWTTKELSRTNGKITEVRTNVEIHSVAEFKEAIAEWEREG